MVQKKGLVNTISLVFFWLDMLVFNPKNIFAQNIQADEFYNPAVTYSEATPNDPILNRWSGRYIKHGNGNKRLATIEWRVMNKNYKTNPPPPDDGTKIKIPVGVIRWDSWASTGMIVPGLRAAFSKPQTEDYAPWFSTHTADEMIEFDFYNFDTKSWETEERLSKVNFTGDRPGIMEQEVEMARGSGIDFWAFNWYPDEATQSYARRQFVQMPNKQGMKAAYITELVAMEDRILNHFLWAFQQDWYQKIDEKPLIILAVNKKTDLPLQLKFLKELETRCGCKLYSSLQTNDVPGEKARNVIQNNLNAGTLYGTWNGVPFGRKDHRYIVEEELKEWNAFLNYPNMDLGLNVTVSFTNLGVFASPINGRQADFDFQFNNSTGHIASDDENREQLRNAKNFIATHPEKVKYMMLYSWNEHTEGVKTVSPRKKRDGTIDRSVLNIVGEFVE